MQCITLPKHHQDQPGDQPKCKGFALVTLSSHSQLESLLTRWPWNRPSDSIKDDTEESEEKSHTAGFFAAMKDPNMYILTLIMTAQIVAQTFNMYFPTLAATLGYNRTITLLLCAPPFLLSAVFTFLNSR